MYCKLDELAKLECKFDELDKLDGNVYAEVFLNGDFIEHRIIMPLFNIKHLLKGDKLCQALFFVIEIFVFSYFSNTVALETINISMIRSLLTPIAVILNQQGR